VIIFVGFNMTFFTQFILGAHGMPRRYFTYPERFQGLHAFSSFGAWVLGAGFLIMFTYLIMSLLDGKRAPRNPWGSLTMEWETASPPDPHNFDKDMRLEHGPYDYDTIEVEVEADREKEAQPV
jgi:cytochrome c oxidase subunit 1